MKKKWILPALFLSVFLYARANVWVAKVNGKVIYMNEFKSIYRTQLDIMQIMSNYRMDVSKFRNNKRYQLEFIDGYVANKLLLKKIRKLNKRKRFINIRWLRKISRRISLYIQDQLILKHYYEKILTKKIGRISNKDIARVYNKFRKKFDAKKMSATKAAKIIRKRLKMRKALLLLAKMRERVKNEASIKINYDLFEKSKQ